MEPDCYLVEILHYVNPHLIWVKARNRPDILEQIGVYGVLPLNMELDIDAEEVVTKRCVAWQPAATMVMKKALMEATETKFQPTHIDRSEMYFANINVDIRHVLRGRHTYNLAKFHQLKIQFRGLRFSYNTTTAPFTSLLTIFRIFLRSSIFDTNIHKYGEILIRKADGKLRKLSSYLKKSGFALYDEAAFHQELSLGRILTKLSKNTADEVMKEIESQLNDTESELSLKKQTTVYQAAKKLEALTTDNLDKHNRRIKKLMSGQDVINVLDRKFKDLELCKDVDEVSAGRAVERSKMRSSKVHETVKIKSDETKFNDTSGSLNASRKSDDFIQPDKLKETKYENKGIKDEIDHVDKSATESHEVQSKSRRDEEPDFDRRRRLYPNKMKSTKSKLPAYNVLTHKCIAYSPPGVDKSKLVFKIVPLQPETIGISKEHKEDEINEESKDDMFGDVDSDINIKIIDKDALQKCIDNSEKYDLKKQDERRKSNATSVESPKETEVKSVVDDSSSVSKGTLKSRILQRKLNIHNETMRRSGSGSSVSNTTNKDTSSSVDSKGKEDSDDDVSEILEKYHAKMVVRVVENKDDTNVYLSNKKNYVNPFKNVDPNLSVFVEKLVNPVLMVHTKNDARIEPKSTMSEIPFNTNIHNVLKNMNVQRPMTMQSVSWFSVLRGHSVFLIGPQNSGKTLGYLPSVCRLISDSDNGIVNSVGPTCVIVCATAKSVAEVEFKSKMLLSTKEKIFACYAGMDMLKITTSLLNGCDLFICTPCVLARLLVQTDFGVDLRRLTTCVLDDCERLDVVYKSEVKVVLFKIKEMLKARANKEVKVQFVLASRVWCDFMEPLAKKAPNTVICIGAFQECVLYSKASTTVDFVKAENKNAKVLEFLENNDKNKKTVIVCREDKEVENLESMLKKQKRIVFACNNKMTVEDLRSFNKAWDEYEDPIMGPILICCDGNLSHMNITDAHYLLHYSMPELFSMFCKRFCVLNDNYLSIFKTENKNVAIKIILEDNNAEQLPKICNFVKRCTKEFPSTLDRICQEILTRKDLVKASNLVPICGNLLALGECPDLWYCRERHTSTKTYDEPKEWIPTEGIITFKILHYQTAVLYSARLLSNIQRGGTKKYPQSYSTVSLKMGMFFSQDSNRKLQGIPKIGDLCAVAIKENFFVRCQVVAIVNYYRTGNPNHVLIKIIDEEKLETTRDIYLYHLPKELREIETHVVPVRLAGVLPKDKDITFSDLALNELKKVVDNNDDLYMRGKIVLTVGNTIFVDNIDVCQDLSSMKEVVVKHNFKELLEPHSEAFPDHIMKLKSCLLPDANVVTDTTENTDLEEVAEVKPNNKEPKAQWAHLDREGLSLVYFTSALDPGTFFVRLAKFEETMTALGKDIDKYVEVKPDPLTNVKEKDIVLAKYPDDECYERARVDAIEGNKALCFFVDHGDWREMPLKHLIEIPDKFISRIPFQAIECRLIGIQPVGDNWTDFSTNWLCDRCASEDLKGLYVQHFSSGKAKHTGGTKYAVALIDTSNDQDVVYNTLMIDLNLAAADEKEIDILNNMDYMKSTEDWEKPNVETNDKSNHVTNRPIRSVPLIADDEDSDSDRWSINMGNEFMDAFKAYNANKTTSDNVNTNTKPQTKSADTSNMGVVKIDNEPTMSDYEVIAPLKIKELDSDDLSSAESQNTKSEVFLTSVYEGRKPKLLWRQNKSMTTLKIMLLGADKYELNILERSLTFSATVYDTLYKFDLVLYGIVNKNKSTHSNKGQYILVKLVKQMQKNWLSLTKGNSSAKWIVYDVDSIDTSSDEEAAIDNNMLEVVKNLHKDDSESDDDDFCDDADYNYKRK